MTVTGDQIKAARALAGIDQRDLARAAGLNPATVSRLEGAGPRRADMTTSTLEVIVRAFAAAGVTFVNDDWPGVRLRKSDPA